MASKPVRALRARQSFTVGGVGRVHRGQLVRSDDPIVKDRGHLFDDVDETLGIEKATKNPGQKRAAKQPAAKSTAKTSAAKKDEEG